MNIEHARRMLAHLEGQNMPAILHEVSGMRLVLVHALAQLSPSQLRTISNSISNIIEEAAKIAGLGVETVTAAGREAADDIIADALQLNHGKEES